MPQEERDFIRRLARERRRKRQRIPEHAALIDTQLDDRFTDLWDAFLDLKSSAGIGFAPEPISTADLLAWCEIHDVAPEDRRTFWRVVHHLDGVARREMAQRKEVASGQSEAGS